MQGFSPQNTQNDAERGVWVLLIFPRVLRVLREKSSPLILAPWQPAKPPANNLFTPLGVSTRRCQTRLRGLEPAPLRPSFPLPEFRLFPFRPPTVPIVLRDSEEPRPPARLPSV